MHMTITEPNLRRTMQISVKNRDVSNKLEKTTSTPVWLITGSSSGLGRALASAVLHRGHRVILTARNTAPMQVLADAFPEPALVCPLHITKPHQITTSVTHPESPSASTD